jgi:hypothetical protein
MAEYLCSCIGLITIEHNALMITLPKLLDFRHCWSNTLCYAGFEKMRISRNPERPRHTVCKTSIEGISTGWKKNFQSSGKLGHFTIV